MEYNRFLKHSYFQANKYINTSSCGEYTLDVVDLQLITLSGSAVKQTITEVDCTSLIGRTAIKNNINSEH